MVSNQWIRVVLIAPETLAAVVALALSRGRAIEGPQSQHRSSTELPETASRTINILAHDTLRITPSTRAGGRSLSAYHRASTAHRARTSPLH